MTGPEQIRALIAHNPIWLAPMAGVNDVCFRGICKRMGAGMTYSEMISATGLHYNFAGEASQRLLQVAPEEKQIAIQLFGADPVRIAEQASEVVQHLGKCVAFIDLNMGCPVSKVVKKGEGSALMTTPQLAASIVENCVARLRGSGPDGRDVPVTVKFRRGYAPGDESAASFAHMMEQAGASAVAVHGRYQEQFYQGANDPDTIRSVVQAVDIPVIGSGDVFRPEDALRMIAPLAEGGIGADAVMVARGARGNPWIFAQTNALRAGERAEKPSFDEIFSIMHEHASCMERTYGSKALVRMRKHAMWYCAGMPGASKLRGRINAIATMSNLEALIEEYRAYLAKTEFVDR